MKKKYLISLVVFIFLIGKQTIAQVSNNSSNELNSSKKLSLEEEMEGTYEIIITNSKIKDAFTIDILSTIEAKREQNLDIMYVVSEYTSIRIFSRDKINSPEFKNRKK